MFNSLNHNENLNPHNQYDNMRYYSTEANDSLEKRWIEILQFTVQYSNQSKNYDNKSRGLQLAMYYRSENAGSRPLASGFVDIGVIFDNSGVTVPRVEKLNITTTDVHFTVGTQLIDSSRKEYLIRVFAWVPNNYMNVMLKPIFFDSYRYSINPYEKVNCSTENKWSRLDLMFKNLKSQVFITDSDYNYVITNRFVNYATTKV